jgi:hypothetical protein
LAAANKAGVTPVFACQQLDDERALTVTARRQDDCFIAPFHAEFPE